jgi:hypothetical protein
MHNLPGPGYKPVQLQQLRATALWHLHLGDQGEQRLPELPAEERLFVECLCQAADQLDVDTLQAWL